MHFFRNPGIARLVAVEGDVKPQNINFAKIERGGGGAINREGSFIWINTVSFYFLGAPITIQIKYSS